MNQTISEEDLLRIFMKREKKRNSHFRFFTFLYRLLMILIVFSLGYIAINFQALSSNFNYWYKTDYTNQPTDNAVAPPTPGVPTIESTKRDVPEMDNNSIALPVLDIKAPITFNVNNTAKEVSDNLQNGTIQINGTALPGQIGNVYITGHSSNYVWAKGNYNSVFALLDKLVVGDMIYVKYKNIIYEYKVDSQRIVYPKDVSVLKSSGQSELTLVTCWPVGTSLKRVVISAEQIFPDPALNTKTDIPPAFQDLPSGR